MTFSLGLYALGALDDEERRMVEQHLFRCAQCREEGADLLDLVAVLPPEPPAFDDGTQTQ